MVFYTTRILMVQLRAGTGDPFQNVWISEICEEKLNNKWYFHFVYIKILHLFLFFVFLNSKLDKNSTYFLKSLLERKTNYAWKTKSYYRLFVTDNKIIE